MAPFVLSASRRTDIPAFYMPWFMQSLDRGFFEVVNPYNKKTSRVPADPDQVHSVVFWSKNFGPFLRDGCDLALAKRGYRLFFNFTLNSPDPRLEPALPPLHQRLDQLDHLAQRFGGACIQWRFDPICHVHDPSGLIHDNLGQFETIARRASAAGVSVCITSFVDIYNKVSRRVPQRTDLEFIDPGLDKKAARLVEMQCFLANLGIELHLCCERRLLEVLPAGAGLRPAACIPGRHLANLHGPGISVRKDPGQRASAGCRCTVSKDIGSYALHPCAHNCLYCYANPAGDALLR